MSPQDAMLHLKNSMQHAGVAAAAAANGTSPGSNQAISGMVANSIPLWQFPIMKHFIKLEVRCVSSKGPSKPWDGVVRRNKKELNPHPKGVKICKSLILDKTKKLMK